MTPIWPDPVKIRSAIIIVEMEDGSTMQTILTPTRWQPVEVQMDAVREKVYGTVHAPHGEPTWTVTVTAGRYAGQLRTAGATAEQVGPQAVES